MSEKMKMESLDKTSQNIDKIAELFPNCITESKDKNGNLKKVVNFEMLKQMLSDGVLEGNEAYEFTWVGKKAAIVESNRPIRKTLRPRIEESVDWDTTKNLYIKGDNLEVLKLLQESYLNKIKMIYIDPPYNTGHDFVYPDSFIMNNDDYNEGVGYFDEDGNVNYGRENNLSAGKYHSDWCSMIYSRLLLSRNLLSDDGFIAISIGEEESYNLRKICNEIFGESNFRNILAVRRYDKNLNLQFASNGLSTMNVGLEYILIYSKNPSSKMKAVYRESSEERSSQGYWKGFWNNADRPTMRYEVLGVLPTDGQWKWKKEVADEAVANYIEYEEKFATKMTLEEYWKNTGKTKRFVRRNQSGTGKNLGVEHWVAPADGILRNSNWSDILVSKPAGMGIKFDSPKNPELISEIIELLDVHDDDIVLDFFSGSASTADAVMQKNLKDKHRIKYIMVQIAETCNEKSEAYKAGYKTICDIGEDRIRKVGQKIKNDNPIESNMLDLGFRVFELSDSNMNDVYYSANDYTQDLIASLESNIKSDRNDLDLLFGCLLEWGLPLSMPLTIEEIEGFKVHTYNDGDLIACFNENIPDSVVKAIAKRQPLRAVFRDSSFEDSPAKINVSEIFKIMAPDTRVKVI